MGRVDLFRRELDGLGDEVLDGGCFEERRSFEDDVADLVAAAGEEAVGVAKADSVLQKEEADPARIERDGEDAVAGALGGREADGESVVVVVDELTGTGKTSAHAAQSGARLGGDVGGELVEEAIELGLRRGSGARFTDCGF